MTPEEQYRFDQFRYGLHQATPRAFVAKIVVVMNVIVYLAMVATGYDPINSDTPQSMVMLFDWGANYGPFTVDGEWWRLLTCAFLHGPIYHIGINMWVLWTEGPLVERMLGNAGFAVLYIVSALAGSVVGGSTMVERLKRAVDILAFFDRPGTSNGPTEAINGRLEHLRGSALGFRNLTHYIARSLLEAGGFRPLLHPRLR